MEGEVYNKESTRGRDARRRNAPGSEAFLEESLRATVGRAATAKLEATMAAMILVGLR